MFKGELYKENAIVTNSTTTTGHALSEANWLDTHFEVARTINEAMIRDADIQSGWHVLDAGCGGGSFLPLISQSVGPTGQITALDLAPENVAIVEQRAAVGHFACPTEHQQALAQGGFGYLAELAAAAPDLSQSDKAIW